MSENSGVDACLRDILAARIRADGPMTVSDYMSICLTHPHHGYYPRRDPLGRGGDFVTAPEISQMFGEMLGLWALASWRQMGLTGMPRLVELGGGRGTLMADAIRAIAKVTGSTGSIVVEMVEISPPLRVRQQQALAAFPVQARWHARYDDVPEGPFILLANEFLDCLPIRQWQRRDGQWHERLVGLDGDGGLSWGLAPFASTTLPMEIAAHGMRDGVIVEHSSAAHALIAAVAARVAVQPGLALFVDYGSVRRGFGDTLQAVSAHRFVDPLAEPGQADVTAHVDFAGLAATARRVGAQIGGPVTQAAFLSGLGITERAARLAAGKTTKVQDDIAAALDRLISPAQMGDLFKVMSVSTAGLAPPFFAASGEP